MPREPSLPNRFTRWERFRRLDRIAADLNVLLVTFAIGLATLDLTFLVTQRLIDRLPAMTRIVYVAEPAVPPSVPSGHADFP